MSEWILTSDLLRRGCGRVLVNIFNPIFSMAKHNGPRSSRRALDSSDLRTSTKKKFSMSVRTTEAIRASSTDPAQVDQNARYGSRSPRSAGNGQKLS